MAICTAPCCHKSIDVPVELAACEHTLVICPHCGAALTFAASALWLAQTEIEGDLARLLDMLQDMQAQPENYACGNTSSGSTGRGKAAAPGIH